MPEVHSLRAGWTARRAGPGLRLALSDPPPAPSSTH